MQTNKISRKDIGFFLFVFLQIVFWFYAARVTPDMTILPPLSSETTVKATAFGDEQFYFRVLGMEIQNAGDSFGRATPLKDYDYKTLQGWFNLLDALDPKSNYIPSLAAYYYSNTQTVGDTRFIIDYLETHADRDPVKKWWWYSQGMSIANYRLKDKKRALELAYKLAAVENDTMPIWTRQMPAILLSDLGETEQAIAMMLGIARSYENLSEGERNYMNYFIATRGEELKEKLEQMTKELGTPNSVSNNDEP